LSKTADNESFHAPSEGSSGEGQEEIYFKYSATLRIFGVIAELDEITQRLGVAPSSAHRKGERFRGSKNLPPYDHDMWMYEAPVKETEPLHVHIDALRDTFRDRIDYLLHLKQDLTVDVFLGYQSNCDHAGVEVPYRSLELFRELQVPFGLSIIVV